MQENLLVLLANHQFAFSAGKLGTVTVLHVRVRLNLTWGIHLVRLLFGVRCAEQKFIRSKAVTI